MLGGELLGAYCLSEAGSGSDAAALQTRAVRDGDAYVVDGTKAWVTHGGEADFYNLMVRTGGAGPKGISLPARPGGHARPGAAAARAQDGHAVQHHRLDPPRAARGSPADRLLGEEGRASASR